MTAHRPPDDRLVDAAIGRASDDPADRIHLLLAGAQLFSLPLATTPSAWFFALLMIWVVVRLPNNWRSYEPLFQRWLPWTMLAAGAWIALSIAWSSDPAQGFDEIGAWRMGLLVVALWPVRDRAAWLVGAALLGVAAQNANQLLQVAGWINLRPDESAVGRYGGWLHPIQTGTWCGAALCWHTAAILTARARWWPYVIGAAAAGLGLLLTGSRGPWLATAIVLPVLVLAVALLQSATRVRAVVLVGLFAVTIAVAAAVPNARTYVRERVVAAAAEYRAAVDEERYLSDVGMRLGLARWALEIGRESPIVGSGAGSYGDALEALPSHQEWRATNPRTRRERNQVERTFPADHAHNSILHIFATSGLVGVALCLLVLGVILLGALRNFRAIPFGAATPFVVVAWFIGSQFDTFHLAGQLCGLLCLCAFLSVAGPPPGGAAGMRRIR